MFEMGLYFPRGGNIRKDPAFTQGIKWVVCGDNMVRGTSGNTILNAELL